MYPCIQQNWSRNNRLVLHCQSVFFSLTWPKRLKNKCMFSFILGDKVLLAILGEKKKGILVGVKKHQPPRIPKFDTNNVVLIDDTGTPLGNRIHVPIPVMLRTILKEKTFAKGVDYTKILALATRFVWLTPLFC